MTSSISTQVVPACNIGPHLWKSKSGTSSPNEDYLFDVFCGISDEIYTDVIRERPLLCQGVVNNPSHFLDLQNGKQATSYISHFTKQNKQTSYGLQIRKLVEELVLALLVSESSTNHVCLLGAENFTRFN